MHVQLDSLHLLIYAAMLACLLAVALSAVSRAAAAGRGLGAAFAARAGEASFAAGFVLAIVAFILRWIEVRHVPLQNMFEVFLTLGVVLYPLSLLCRRLVGGDSLGLDAMIAFVVLFPAGLVFKSDPQHLPPALQDWLFIPHVAAYMLAYIILAMAAAQAVLQLFAKGDRVAVGGVNHELAAYRLVTLAFPLLTLGLVLGAWWGKKAWGDYWQWDPKELWSLITWLIFLAYMHLRCAAGARWPRINSVLVILGGLAVVLTLLWVNLSRLFPGMHSYASP